MLRTIALAFLTLLAACAAEPSCSDGEKSGAETDVDCGAACVPCATGRGCAAAADCSSGLCEARVCAPAATCGDGQKNGTEAGVDCGAVCATPCGDGTSCKIATDCSSGA